MGSVEINDAVNEVNQKVIQTTSKKVTNLQNPIKVLVMKQDFKGVKGEFEGVEAEEKVQAGWV